MSSRPDGNHDANSNFNDTKDPHRATPLSMTSKAGGPSFSKNAKYASKEVLELNDMLHNINSFIGSKNNETRI